MKHIHLDESIINQKVDEIMNEINQFKRRKSNFRWIVYPTFSMILTLVFVFVIAGLNHKQPILQPSFHLEKVNANLYHLTFDEDSLKINILTLVENSELISFNEDLSYYNGFNKYIDVSERTELELIQVHNHDFLKVTIDQRFNKYYYVYHAENTIILDEIQYEFRDFNSQLTDMFIGYDLYPPKTVHKSLKDISNLPHHSDDILIEQYQEHPQFVENYPELYLIYSWFITYINKINYFYYDGPPKLDGFRLQIHMDGNEINLGNLDHITIATYGEGVKMDPYSEIEFPVRINQCPINQTGKSSGNTYSIYYNYANELCSNENYKNKNIVSLWIDFSQYTKQFNFNDYQIFITIHDSFTQEEQKILITPEHALIANNKLYILGLPMERDLNWTYTLYVKITVKDLNGKLISID